MLGCNASDTLFGNESHNGDLRLRKAMKDIRIANNEDYGLSHWARMSDASCAVDTIDLRCNNCNRPVHLY